MLPANNDETPLSATNSVKGFFVVEGVEGSGKSTLINSLIKVFQDNGTSVIQTREPGGTEIGGKLRKLLLDKSEIKISPLTELLIFYADRSQHLNDVIKPGISTEKLIICDRFTYSTLAYQAFGRGIDRKTIENLNNIVVQNVVPKGVILLDLDPMLALSRVEHRGALDRFEEENLDFHRRIREGYLTLAQENANLFNIIDASLSPEIILEKSFNFILAKSNGSI